MRKLTGKEIVRLKSCDERLQKIILLAADKAGLYVLCGYRDEHDQNLAYETGASKLKYPQSKHNKSPSLAIDVIPHPINWTDLSSFVALSLIIKDTAKALNVEISSGADWKWKDYPHYELVR